MKPAELSAALELMQRSNQKASDLPQVLFEAIDRHDKFSTVPTSREIRDWLDRATIALENQQDVDTDICDLLSEIGDEAQAVTR